MPGAAAATEESIGMRVIWDDKKSRPAMELYLQTMNRISDGQSRVSSSARTMGAGLQKAGGFFRGAAQQALGFATGMFAFQGITAIFSAMSQQIPAVGMAFAQAGRVMQANFFWPLTQQLLPLLRSFTNWVRDNRKTFARIGVIIADVFKVTIETFKAFGRIVKVVIDGFFEALGRGKITFRDVLDFMQLALLKFTFVMLILEVLATAAFRSIFAGYKKWIQPVIDGFMEGFGETISDIFDSMVSDVKSILGGADFSGIWDTLFGGLDRVETLNTLGNILRDTFLLPLRAVQMLVKGVRILVDGFRSLADFTSRFRADPFGMIADFAERIHNGIHAASRSLFEFINQTKVMKKLRNGFASLVMLAFDFWKGLKKAVAETWSGFVEFAEALPGVVADGLQKAQRIMSALTKKWGDNILNAVVSVVGTPWKAAKKRFNEFIKKVQGGVNRIDRFISGIPKSFKAALGELKTFWENSAIVKWLESFKLGEKFRKTLSALEKIRAAASQKIFGNESSDATNQPVGGEKTGVKGLTPMIHIPRPGPNVNDNSVVTIHIDGSKSPAETAETVKRELENRREKTWSDFLLMEAVRE